MNKRGDQYFTEDTKMKIRNDGKTNDGREYKIIEQKEAGCKTDRPSTK